MKPLRFSVFDFLKPFDDRSFNLFRNEHPAESDQELFFHVQSRVEHTEDPFDAINHYEPFIR